MTNITELAQRARINAECGEHLSPAETMELVEALENSESRLHEVAVACATAEQALEKAQAVMNAVVTAAAIRGVRPFDGIDCDPPTLEENAEACGDAMSARIRELEANPPKPHHNGLMQISNELASAKQRIAELESRTVTVKLPERYACELGYNAPDPSGDMLDRDDVLAMLADAGIKVEAE